MTTRSRDPQLIDKTARLIEFLRELVSARRRPIRDVDDYEAVHWLHDLPAEVDVDTDAEAGEVLFRVEAPPQQPPPVIPDLLDGWLTSGQVRDASLDVPPLAGHGPVTEYEVVAGETSKVSRDVTADEAPAVVRAYEEWLPGWRRWAERERVLTRWRRWHNGLWAHAATLSQLDDEFELVLATGLLTWKSPRGAKVRNHLLVSPVEIRKDEETLRIEVVLGMRMTSQERSILDDLDGYDPLRTDHVRATLREGEVGPGPGKPVSALLEDWCGRAFDHGATYLDTWEPPAHGSYATEVRQAPALVFRKRDRASLVSYYEQMLEALTGQDAQAPLGLTQLVAALEPDERMAFMREQGRGTGVGSDPLFPLPANPEQRQIIDRLREDNGVVVQGPPGTGKTHTIANLVASLLAEGQRVLVTSQKGQALRVLRDKLPTDLAHLCVSVTDQARGGSAELEGSVKSLSSRHSSYDRQAQEKRVARAQGRLADARRTVARLTEDIRTIREAETYDHGTVAPGYHGTLAGIVARVKKGEPVLGWMPKGGPATPPITAGEAQELLALLAAATPGRAARVDQLLPDPGKLPSAERVRGLIAAEAAALEAAGHARDETSQRLESCDDELFAFLEAQKEIAEAAFHELDGRSDAWVDKAVRDGLLGRDAALWDQLESCRDRSAALARAVAALGFRTVVLPAPAAAGPNSLAGQLTATQRLRDYLAGGGKLKRGLFASAVQKDAEPILREALVDGISPTNVELLDLVLAELHGRAASIELTRGWAMVGAAFPEGPLQRVSTRFTETYEQLDQVRSAVGAITRAARKLADAGIRIPLRTPEDWSAYAASLRAVRLRLDAERATRDLLDLGAVIEMETAKGQAPPELVAASRAVAARDADLYGTALAGLADAHRELRDQRRCDDLLAEVRDAHAALARIMMSRPDDPAWQERLSSWDRAWAWARAAAFFDGRRQPGLEQRLEAQLEAETKRRLQLTAELAAEKAWHECLGRMTTGHSQALRAYRDYMSKLGKGTGRYAPRYRARAREAMRQALNAVPAWIMPLSQVVETIPPVRDSFDVVIVDEASQAGVDALFLLWLAPRVIVVGDDKQCAPSMIGRGELEPIFTKLAGYLPDMPAYLRDVFTPSSSLFDVLSTRFGSVIRLKEHFRCMPEIIQYSSRQFYDDEPLIPLRQFGADRLPPLRTVRVTGAFTEGTATRLRNQAEAEAVVETIKRCVADPAYEGRTIGVVVLQGTGQVQLIQNLLQQDLDLKELDRRKIRVGTPPDFQGDERDVVFLSMVVAEQRSAVTSTEWQRRFNVAASRAKDQMWLFHSITPDLLRSTDLRRSLLTYMLNPPAALTASDVPGDVRPDERHPDFDSLFEQRVFLEIRERGYHVVPQFEVNGRRIDLVVSGARGRLAVECDGDHWHSTAEQRAHDEERERELRRAGWRFWRVRESEFFFSRENALASLWTTLESLGIQPGDHGVPEPDGTSATWETVRLADVEGWDGLEDGDVADLESADAVIGPAGSPARRAGRTAPSPAAPRRAVPAAPASPPPARPGLRPVDRGKPRLVPGLAIDDYKEEHLVALIRWYGQDGRKRTVAELTDLVVADLRIEHTRKVTETVHHAITVSRRDARPRFKDRQATEWRAGTAEVREWARRNRYEMDDERIPSHVVMAYNRAHPDRPY